MAGAKANGVDAVHDDKPAAGPGAPGGLAVEQDWGGLECGFFGGCR